MASGARQSGERIEWIVAAASVVLVLALAGFIGFEALTRSGGEPRVELALEDRLPIADGHVAKIKVRNRGYVTISDVVIEGVVALEDGETELASVTLDYLPAEGETEVGLGFSQEIDPERLTLRIAGYTYP